MEAEVLGHPFLHFEFKVSLGWIPRIPKGEWWLDYQSYLWRNCLLGFFILGAALSPSLFLELHSVLPEAMMVPNSYQTLKNNLA